MEKQVWIVKGVVTDPEIYLDENPDVEQGGVEWQFSDGPPGERGSSSDFLSLEEGLKYYSGYQFFWDPYN